MQVSTRQESYGGQKQVAWIGNDSGGPKFLHKRDLSVSPTWARVRIKDREVEFATFQQLRRSGYILVTDVGGPVLDTDGTVMGTQPLPPATSNISMDAVKQELARVRSIDLTDIPEGEVACTRLLSLEQRMSLIRFKDTLADLPRETIMGYLLEVNLYLQGQVGKDMAKASATMAPEWMEAAMRMCDPTVLGQTVEVLASHDKDTLIGLLEQMLPEMVRLHGMRANGIPEA